MRMQGKMNQNKKSESVRADGVLVIIAYINT